VGDNAVLLIEISGASSPGVVFNILGPGGGSTVRGLAINRTGGGDAIAIGTFTASSNNTITGNFIGVDPTGTTLPDVGTAPGVNFASGSSNTFGGSTPAARNVIAGNGGGAFVILQRGGGSHPIQGNRIGTNAAGTAALGNSFGIGTNSGSANNTIGGSAAGAGNLISGNSVGIALGDGATAFTVQGNKIGTDITGTLPIPNTSNGIGLSTASGGSVIGGTNAGEGNIVAFNGGAGVSIQNAPGLVGWKIEGNSIFSNGGLG